MKALTRLILACSVIGTSAMPNKAAAEEQDSPSSVENVRGLRYELEPYLWLPVGVSGNATLRGRDVPIDAGFSDLMSKFDAGAFLHFEAWMDRFGLIANGMFLSIGGSRTIGGPRDIASAATDWSSRTLMGDLLAGFRPVELRFGHESIVRFELDAGVRFAWLDQDAQIAGRSLSGNRSFARLLLGGRIPVRLSRLWAIGVHGGVSLPDPGWAVLGWVEADPLSWLAIRLGYNVENLNWASNDIGLKVTAHGPYLGVGFRFGAGPIY
jgi:hypothetical protein